MGILFLFDRLLPAYQIREEHYQIESFYKLAPRGTGDIPADDADELGIRRMHYLRWANIPVVKVTTSESRKIERCLIIIKAIGLIMAVFLVAAVNALISH